MKSATRGACLLACAILCSGGLAKAGDPATAEALFRSGREASKRGDHELACQRYRESYRLDAAPGTLLNIGDCEEALHHLANAWESYLHVVESLPAGDDRMALVKERIAALDARLPRLTLRLRALDSSTTVLRDGALLGVGAFGVELPVDPGEHRIVVRSPNRRSREYVVHLAEGDHLSLDLEPGDVLPPEPRVAKSDGSSHTGKGARALRTAGYVAGGLGLAGFVTVGVLTGLALHEKTVADDHCPARHCDPEGVSAVSRGDRLLRLANVGLVVGALGVSLGGILVWQSSRAELRVRHEAGGARVSYALKFQ